MASIQSRGTSPLEMPRSNNSISGGTSANTRLERVVEQFEPRGFGVAQVDDHAGALGRLDARLAHRGLQPVGLGPLRSFRRWSGFYVPT